MAFAFLATFDSFSYSVHYVYVFLLWRMNTSSLSLSSSSPPPPVMGARGIFLQEVHSAYLGTIAQTFFCYV